MNDFNSKIAPRFWEIIGEAQQQPEKLRAFLQDLPQKDLERFNEEFDYAVDDLISCVNENDKLDLPQDTMTDIAAWVVSQGRDYFDEVLKNPDACPSEDEIDDSQSFYGIVNVVYEERFGKQIPEYSWDRWRLE